MPEPPSFDQSIFISYSRDDEKLALHLLGVLRNEGYTVWIDQEAIPGATIWSDEIVRNIKACEIFIALLSVASVSSANVGKEIAIAAEHGKIILPVEIGHVTLPGRLEYALAGIQRTNIHDEEAILRAVRSRIATLGGPNQTKPKSNRHTLYLGGAIAVAVLVAVVGAVFIFRKPSIVTMPSNTVVILPFATLNLDHDSTHNLDIFSDALVSTISSIKSLSTSAMSVSTPFKDSPLNSLAIAKELKTRFIIEGLARKSHDRTFLMVRLTDSWNHGEIWEESYTGGENELFSIRDRVCRDLSEFLQGLVGREEEIREDEKKIADHPNDPREYAELGSKLIAIDNQRAVALFTRAIQLDSNADNYYLLAGIAEERQKNFNRAKDFGRIAELRYQKNAVIYPDSLPVQINLAIALDLVGKRTGAEQLYESLMKKYPTNVKLLYNAACSFAKDGKTDQAVHILRSLFSIAPGKHGEVESDPDFDNIRLSPDYIDLMRSTALQLH